MMNMIALNLAIGHNMWVDKHTQLTMGAHYNQERDYVLFERSAWDKIVKELPKLGVNTVIIDLAEGVKYDCAPELALPGTLEKTEFKEMLNELIALGLTAIPKLDFSAAHDVWMGNYAKMPGTEEYREFVKKLIAEVAELFGKPAYFHLGLADESIQYQTWYGLSIVRGPKCYWEDVYAMFDAVRAAGARPMIFGEYFYREPEIFTTMVPKDVIVCAQFAARFLDACDRYGRDRRTDAQKKFEALCELPNELFLCGQGLPLRQNITEMFWFAKQHPEKNILGVGAFPNLPTTDLFDYALLNEAMRLGKGKEYYDHNDFV